MDRIVSEDLAGSSDKGGERDHPSIGGWFVRSGRLRQRRRVAARLSAGARVPGRKFGMKPRSWSRSQNTILSSIHRWRIRQCEMLRVAGSGPSGSTAVSATPFFGSLVSPERAFQSVLDVAIESLPLGHGTLPNL
jgi:hypothetical protein